MGLVVTIMTLGSVLLPITRTLEELTPSDGPGLAVGVFRGRTLLDAFALGYANLEYREPITPETAFHVASLSKQFTAYAVAILEERGLLGLDQKVTAFLPELPSVYQSVQVRHLLHHTSGMRDQWVLMSLGGWRENDPISTDDIVRLIGRQQSLHHDSGTRFLYCNTGYTLLAEIVRVVTGVPIAVFLDAELFRPLGMGHTRFREDYRDVRSYEADCYQERDGLFLRTVPPFQTVGATSLQTSINDLSRWFGWLQRPAKSLASNRLYTPGSLASGEEISYGWGLYSGTFAGRRTLSHGGWDYAFSSYIVFVPDEDIAIAVLSNGAQLNLEACALWVLSHYVSCDTGSRELLERSIQPLSSQSRFKTRPEQLDWETIGVFGDPHRGDVRLIQRSGDDLRVNAAGHLVPLSKVTPEGFVASGTVNRYDFSRDRHLLRVSSSTQGVSVELPRIRSEWSNDLAELPGKYQSTELDPPHTISVDGRRLTWERWRRAPIPLERIGEGLFYGESFVLSFETDALIISHPRSPGFRFIKQSSSRAD